MSLASHSVLPMHLPIKGSSAQVTCLYRAWKKVYIEAFKDHDNQEDIGYQWYGQDFLTDILGTLDLLWPLVVLMLQMQAQWCPGWKLERYIPKVREQMQTFCNQWRTHGGMGTHFWKRCILRILLTSDVNNKEVSCICRNSKRNPRHCKKICYERLF